MRFVLALAFLIIDIFGWFRYFRRYLIRQFGKTIDVLFPTHDRLTSTEVDRQARFATLSYDVLPDAKKLLERDHFWRAS